MYSWEDFESVGWWFLMFVFFILEFFTGYALYCRYEVDSYWGEKFVIGTDRNREMLKLILEEWNDMLSIIIGSVEGRMARLEYNVFVSSVIFKKVVLVFRRMEC